MTNSIHPYRNAAGHFTAGNPGRKPGTRVKLSKSALSRIEGSWDEFIDKLLESAIAGDVQAAKLIVGMVLPKGLPLKMDDVSPEGLTSEIKQGNLTPLEARQMASTIGKLTDLKDLERIKERMEYLERIVGNVH